eukprot:5627180-Pyramimonas_sp.AAC.1
MACREFSVLSLGAWRWEVEGGMCMNPLSNYIPNLNTPIEIVITPLNEFLSTQPQREYTDNTHNATTVVSSYVA